MQFSNLCSGEMGREERKRAFPPIWDCIFIFGQLEKFIPPKKEVPFLILMLLKGLDVLESCPWSPSRSFEILNNIHKIWRLCLMSSNVFYTRAQNRCRRGFLIQKHLQKACVLHFLFIDLNSCRIFKLIENETLYGWPFCSLHSIFL